MIFPTLEGKIFQLCLKSDIFPTLTPNTNKISTQTKKYKISQLWPKNANFFNSDQNMHAMYAHMIDDFIGVELGAELGAKMN